eukprot:EC792051.1.p1 GENE.EC792051.1~~EC792051.1.p1  ORF type:complete len:128 (+),score=42.08 EC792051.1:162-545(+)
MHELDHSREAFETFVMQAEGSVTGRIYLDVLFMVIADGHKWESARMSIDRSASLAEAVLAAMSSWDPVASFTDPAGTFEALYPYYSKNFYPEFSPEAAARLGGVSLMLFNWLDGAHTLMSLARDAGS